MNTFLGNLILGVGLLTAPAVTDRPTTAVRINDQPMRLTIDTCAGRLIVFSYAADRIGLKYHKPRHELDPSRVKPGRVPLFLSYPCRLQIDDPDISPLRIRSLEGRRRLWIGEIPPGLELAGIDGVIGWPNLSKGIVHIDWGQKVLESLPEVPSQALRWRDFKLYSPSGIDVLTLQVPESCDSRRKAVYIDTGDLGGVRVTSALWKEIVSQHPGLPMAIEGWYTPVAGCVLQRICWLRTLKLGSLELHDVPVSEMPQAEQRLPSCLAVIGLYGLTRLELVVDASHNRAHVKAKQDYSKEYNYNRSGVVFLPADNRSSDLVATVLEGGPASDAGIRNGDRLLRVNGRDVTGWRADPNGMTEGPSSSTKPAGTKLNLTITRGAQLMDVTIVLKELLPIETAP